MQIQTGTASVGYANSLVVASLGNDWGSASVGSLFSVIGDTVQYEIIEVASPGTTVSGHWEITLSAPYKGADDAVALYVISVDFTPNLGFPLITPGDLQTALLLNRWAKQLDTMSQLIALGSTVGLASESGTVDLPHGVVAPVNIVFDTPKISNSYDVSVWIENASDSNPSFIPVVITSKTTTGFRVLVIGNPDSSNYVLHWRAGNIVYPSADFITAAISGGSPISLTTNVVSNIVSISVPPGTWDVYGLVTYSGPTASITRLAQGVTDTSATFQSIGFTQQVSAAFIPGSGIVPQLNTALARFSTTTTTVFYLVAVATFTVSTLAASGRISARRV